MALAIGLLILRVGVGLTVAAHGSQKLFGWFGGGGIEFPLMIALPALALTLIGPGAVSLDNLFNIALPEPASWIVLAIGTLLTVAAALRSRTLATPAASDSVGAI